MSTQVSSLTHFVINNEDDFRDLLDDWNRLAAATDSRSVFLRHEWFDAAWQWLQCDHEMQIVCFSREGSIVGICPFVIGKARRYGLSLRTLTCFSVPDTQEFSLLSDKADVVGIAAALATYLQEPDVRWDLLEIEKYPASLPSFDAIRDAIAGKGMRVIESTGTDNPGIALASSWEEYYSRRSRRLKKGNNLIANRLKRAEKNVEVRCFDRENLDEKTLSNLLPVLTSLSAKSWKAGTGLTLDNSGPQDFARRLTDVGVRNGWLLAWVLSIDDVPAAMELQLEFRGVVSGLRADYDMTFDEYSPGTLLNWRIIEMLFDRDVDYYALGPGNNTYKLRWSEETVELRSLLVYGNTFVALIVQILATRVHPVLRSLRAMSKKAFNLRD